MNNQLKQLEERALKAEEKIAKLEDSLARQGYAANGGDVSALRKRYVEELMQLRGTLVHAEEEHAALENKVIMVCAWYASVYVLRAVS